MKKILITGANGMLGKSIQKFFSLLDYSIIPTDIHNLNITDFNYIIWVIPEIDDMSEFNSIENLSFFKYAETLKILSSKL